MLKYIVHLFLVGDINLLIYFVMAIMIAYFLFHQFFSILSLPSCQCRKMQSMNNGCMAKINCNFENHLEKKNGNG